MRSLSLGRLRQPYPPSSNWSHRMKRIVLVVLLFVSASVFGQGSRATLTGRVTDSTGAVIPKASVAVTSEDTGAISKTVSGRDGYYTVPFLPPGKYQIDVTVAGFTPYLHKD